jgi:hypothetical protein
MASVEEIQVRYSFLSILNREPTNNELNLYEDALQNATKTIN